MDLELQKTLFKNGECKYVHKSVNEVKEYVNNQFNTLWDAYKRFSNPKRYKVDLSNDLWTLKSNLLDSRKHL
jgi:nicotinate phosphoribosyltransferase